MAKISIEKKNKLVYTVELLVIAVIFIVIATLEVLNIIGKREVMMIIFNWVTIFGAAWMIADFIWTLVSKRKRARSSLLDKILVLPLAAYFITFDIICFTKQPFVTMEFRRLMMGIAFYYVAAIYIFQGIYHYFHPIPLILQAIKEEETLKEEQEKAKQEAEEKKDEEKLEDK